MSSKAAAREWRWLIVGLLALDSVGQLLALRAASETRFVWQVLPYRAIPDADLYLRLGLVMLPASLALFWAIGLYDRRILLGGVGEYSKIFHASTYAVFAVAVVSLVERQEERVSRGWLILLWAFSVLIISAFRFAARRTVYALRRRGQFIRRAIVAGADDQGVSLASHLSPAESSGVQIVGFVHDYLAPGSVLPGGFKVLGGVADLDDLAREQNVDLVIAVLGALSWDSQHELMRLAADVRAGFECRILPGPYDVVASGVRVIQNGPVPLLSLMQMRLSGPERLLKDALDYAASVLLLTLAFPVAILLAILCVRRGKAIIETREFIGVGGRPFRALGFADWWNNEIPLNGGYLERFLYARRLYRLPGLLNVLRGEMSLVGPRRVTAEELQRQHKWRHTLLSVKPGLTGPWLLAGGEQLTLEESLRLDLHYVRNYSIWLDLQILLYTAGRLLTGLAAPRH